MPTSVTARSSPRDAVPEIRCQCVNEAPVNADGEYVLYWMIALRRRGWNFALQRAVDWAIELGKPLVVLEALRVDYPWASDRMHRFVIEGMADNEAAFADTGVLYYPYVEPKTGAGSGLLARLAEQAAVVVTDDYPCFFLPRMVRVVGRMLRVKLEQVDGNGILPMRAADRVFLRAFDFRRFLQAELRNHLVAFPAADPLQDVALKPAGPLSKEITNHWRRATKQLLTAQPKPLSELPIDHRVPPASFSGGSQAAAQQLREFVERRLDDYADNGNHPDDDCTSGLSPHLHFGHISSHEIFDAVMRRENWSPDKLGDKAHGRRAEWWGASRPAETFLDQLITWRELGFNLCWQDENYDQYDTLPDWAQATLAEHQDDPREHVYTLEQFESAQTHDRVWNAAQSQLVREGRLHNYMRMLWGKKILEWTESPRRALEIMLELNNKYAVDGRDPNSYSGIFWTLGRYDRPWGPRRPIFGTVRYMSSDNTVKKLRVSEYLDRYAPDGQGRLFD